MLAKERKAQERIHQMDGKGGIDRKESPREQTEVV